MLAAPSAASCAWCGGAFVPAAPPLDGSQCRSCWNIYQRAYRYGWRAERAAARPSKLRSAVLFLEEIDRRRAEARAQEEQARPAREAAKAARRAEEMRSKALAFKRRYDEDAAFRERHRERYRRWIAKHPEYLAMKRVRSRKLREGLGDVVYFIRAESGGPIKIGYTSLNPERRLEQLNVGHWETFRLLGLLFGGRDLESQLHRRFSHLSIRGEWFRDAPDLLAFIEAEAVPWSRR